MGYRNELIQVAAVAIAAITDRTHNSTQPYDHQGAWKEILAEVGAERERQEIQWGARHQTPLEWLAILTEEVGEVARAIIENEHDWSEAEILPPRPSYREIAPNPAPRNIDIDEEEGTPVSLHGEIAAAISSHGDDPYNEPHKITLSRRGALTVAEEIVKADTQSPWVQADAIPKMVATMREDGGTLFGLPVEVKEAQDQPFVIHLRNNLGLFKEGPPSAKDHERILIDRIKLLLAVDLRDDHDTDEPHNPARLAVDILDALKEDLKP